MIAPPEMVTLPAGHFMMGSPAHEPGRLIVEGPQRRITIAKPFAVSRYPVMRGAFAAFVAASGYRAHGRCTLWTGSNWHEAAGSYRNPGFDQTDAHPVVCVSWNDGQSYASWLSSVTGNRYRLLSEAEWEYAARGGTSSPFWWGMSISPDDANYNATSTYGPADETGAWRQHTVPVGAYPPNPFGLYQMNGNVWEWVEDPWCRALTDTPADGTPRAADTDNGDSEIKTLRGGSWLNGPRGMRSARRHGASMTYRRSDIGLRLAQTL